MKVHAHFPSACRADQAVQAPPEQPGDTFASTRPHGLPTCGSATAHGAAADGVRRDGVGAQEAARRPAVRDATKDATRDVTHEAKQAATHDVTHDATAHEP